MDLLILGATGRTGRRVLKAARAKGHRTTAFGRRRAEGADRSLVRAFRDAAFAAAFGEADAVLCCLASTNREPVDSNAARAVLAADPGVRYLTVAGAGWTGRRTARAWGTGRWGSPCGWWRAPCSPTAGARWTCWPRAARAGARFARRA